MFTSKVVWNVGFIFAVDLRVQFVGLGVSPRARVSSVQVESLSNVDDEVEHLAQ